MKSNGSFNFQKWPYQTLNIRWSFSMRSARECEGLSILSSAVVVFKARRTTRSATDSCDGAARKIYCMLSSPGIRHWSQGLPSTLPQHSITSSRKCWNNWGKIAILLLTRISIWRTSWSHLKTFGMNPWQTEQGRSGLPRGLYRLEGARRAICFKKE